MRNIRDIVGTANWWHSEVEETASDAEPVEEQARTDLTVVGRKNRWTMRLARAVEGEIIPRLMLSHRAATRRAWPATSNRAEGFTETEVESFATLIVERDFETAMKHVESLREEGRPLQSLFLELFTPAARRLGELWEEDRRDFMDVTVGLSRLQRLLQEIGPDFGENRGLATVQGRALLVSARGEQHTFGLSVLCEFFRREGWDVWNGRLTASEEISGLMKAGPFDLVGFSVSQENKLNELASDIEQVRQESNGPPPHIMVGGRVFIDQPKLSREVGADSTARNAHDALEHANKVVQRHRDARRSLPQ